MRRSRTSNPATSERPYSFTSEGLRLMKTQDQDPGLLSALRARDGWGDAVTALRTVWASAGDQATEHAAQYGQVYEWRRGAMVVDVC
jgi:hypothetical protein